MSTPSDLPHGLRETVPPASSSEPVPLDTAASGGAPASLTANVPGAIFPGALIGQYCLKRELGSGGMGVVYEAEHESLKRRAALKVMNAQTAIDKKYREKFLREAQALAALKSDHVVGVYDYGEQGVLYLVMEYIEGPTLEAWLRNRKSTVGDVLRVAGELLVGLAAAHKRGLIHRDVKPGNVMLDESTGRFKLLDFGLVRDVTPEGRNNATTTTGPVGTPSYMSPEQARAQELDERTDLFSVGVVLYRMVKGKSPFARDSMTEALCAVLTEHPAPLTGVPVALSKFVARLMSPDPAGRPKDATAALAELDQVKAEVALQNAPTEPDFETEPRPRRKLTYAVLVGAVALLAAAAVFLLMRGKPETEVAQAPPEPPPVLPALGPGPLPPKIGPEPKIVPPIVPPIGPKPADLPRRPLSSAEVLKLIVADIDARPGPKATDDKPTRLYLFAPHLASGASLLPNERIDYRGALEALSKRLKPDGELLRALDGDRTLFAVEPLFGSPVPDGVLADYPYGLTFEQPESLRRDDALVREYTGTVAYVRADWFVRYAVKRLAGNKSVYAKAGQVPKTIADWAQRWELMPLTIFRAADELGADREDVKRAILRSELLAKRYQTGALLEGKTVPRARWESREFATSAFQELARELKLGLPVVTE